MSPYKNLSKAAGLGNELENFTKMFKSSILFYSSPQDVLQLLVISFMNYLASRNH